MRKSERRRLKSALEKLLVQMLVTHYQPEKQTPSWHPSLAVQRDDIEEHLNDSPSLRPDLPKLFEKAYKRARIEAANETGLELETFPESCQRTAEEVLAERQV